MEGSPAELSALLQQGFRYALSLSHDRAAAEDLLQDAWVALLQAGGPQVRPYLFSAIRSRFLNRSRRDRLVTMVSLEDHIDSNRFDPPASDDYSPLVRIDRIALEGSLAKLRPSEREALYLSVVEGYTALEIANLTAQARGTVLSLIHRARQKLRRLLESPDREGVHGKNVR